MTVIKARKPWEFNSLGVAIGAEKLNDVGLGTVAVKIYSSEMDFPGKLKLLKLFIGL